jgi:hypothetical protein
MADTIEAVAEKPTRATKAPRRSTLVDDAGGEGDAVFRLGDDVYFSPPQSARDSLRSARGIEVTEWAAKIVFVNKDGTYQLRVFRPFGLSDEVVQQAKHDATGEPGTFRARG